MSPKPSAWASPIRSAPSESSAIAGAQNEPNAIAAATTSGAMKTGRPARASPAVTAMAAPEASRSGSRRPRRSEKRPMSGATTISMAAAPMKSAGDRGGAPAGVSQLQRNEHGHDAEEERRQHHQPERPEDERLPDGAEQRARRLRLGGDRRRAERPDDQHDGHPGDAHERRPGADRLRKGAHGRAEQRAEDGSADRRPQHLAAPLARRSRPRARPARRPRRARSRTPARAARARARRPSRRSRRRRSPPP